MPQTFHRSTNTLSKVSIFGALFLVVGSLFAIAEINRSGYVTQAGVAREQPVPFSHQHHVGAWASTAATATPRSRRRRPAGIPPTKTCMNCHAQIWNQSPTLEPVRASFRSGQSIEWTRVHDLPDFAYFNHSAHVSKGVGCTTCHGPVDRMPLMWQYSSLQMEWCLDCHRAPERYVRPKEEVFSVSWQPPADQIEQGRALVKAYGIQTATSCSACHR
jgi:hypothetical protein